MIPVDLQCNEFRFIKVAPKDKIAIEKKWNDTNNYVFNDKVLLNHIKAGGNYGVLCGFGNLAVIDCDDQELTERVIKLLPITFTVRTGSGGLHFYFIITDLDKKIVVQKNSKEHYGEVQWKGAYVVGPNSIHPNGFEYEVTNKEPIAWITKKQLMEVIEPLLPVAKPIEIRETKGTFAGSIEDIPIESVVNLTGFIKQGDELIGSHPVHGSKSGRNFAVNTSKNCWRCFRCNSGGGVAWLIAVTKGIKDCSEAIK